MITVLYQVAPNEKLQNHLDHPKQKKKEEPQRAPHAAKEHNPFLFKKRSKPALRQRGNVTGPSVPCRRIAVSAEIAFAS